MAKQMTPEEREEYNRKRRENYANNAKARQEQIDRVKKYQKENPDKHYKHVGLIFFLCTHI